MSVKKSLSFNDGNASYNLKNQKSSKQRRFDRCFSSAEVVSMEQGKKLNEMDSNKLKSEIKRVQYEKLYLGELVHKRTREVIVVHEIASLGYKNHDL
ncbi:hypothetical protein P8452_73727 [Trifolium repens]|nr:hypothetical protein P8452_73727 [Trifolium repens]